MAWAFGQRVGNAEKSVSAPSAKLVLLKLADHADDRGHSYPSVRRIADDTELDERTVRRALDHLESRGLILKTKRGRGHEYHLQLGGEDEASTPDNLPGEAAHDTGQLAHDTGQPVTEQRASCPKQRASCPPNHQEPSKNRQGTGGARKRATSRMAANWLPSEKGLLFAKNQGLSDAQISQAVDRFTDHYLGTGRAAADWNAIWRNWIREDVRRANEGTRGLRASDGRRSVSGIGPPYFQRI